MTINGNNNVIEAEGLSRRFGANEAVCELGLAVPAGSIFAFLGPNGAGKTTTIKLLMDILRPTSGEARVLGVPSGELGRAEFERIGYVSENQQQPDWLTVEGLMAYCRPLYPTWDEAFCRELVERFDLPPERKLKHLSRGMKMKAALVSSLAYRPSLLVLDEPFSGLDPVVRQDFIDGVLELTGQAEWSVFVSSHDIDEVERLADWVGIINRGRLVLAEPVESLQGRYRQVEVTTKGDARVPEGADTPASWVRPQAAGRRLSFIETAYDETETAALAQRAAPGFSSLSAEPMSLKEIYLSIARGFGKES